MTDEFELQRFVDAQAPVWRTVEDELRLGRKRSHWMWFVFPQLAGLGHSAMAQRYAIGSLAEARAYLAHPLLGPRLMAAVKQVNGVADRSALDIFGSPDDLKFRSCVTLFAHAAPRPNAFETALARYFGAQADPATVAKLAVAGG